MSVSVLYYKVSPENISSVAQSEQLMAWRAELAENKQLRLKKLRQPADQLLSLAGLQLLKSGITGFSSDVFSLSDIIFPESGKPYLNQALTRGHIDFNISHSGDIVCCVISDNSKVGIDIELHRPIYSATMKKYLKKHPVKKTTDEAAQFFSLWTQKEAIIKAANIGSIHNMDEISLQSQPDLRGGLYKNHFWNCYPVEIMSDNSNNEYTCHVASSEIISEIKVEQVFLL